MPFPWTAAVGGVLGVGGAVADWLGGNAAADAENAEKRKQYIGQRSSTFANTRAQDQSNYLNYQWKIAETEAIRYQEDQEKLDYDFVMGRMADSALASLSINEDAIFDQFVTAEDLRSQGEQLKTGYELGALADKSGTEIAKIGQDLQYQMGDLANSTEFQINRQRIATNDAVRGYINTIQDNALQAQASAMSSNRKLEGMIRDQVIDGQMDALQRDISFAASLGDRGRAKASGLGRGVSASTANSLQMNKAKEVGRSYGELLMRQRKRKNSMLTMNASMQGEVAKGLGRYALASGKAMKDIKSSEEKFGVTKQYQMNKYDLTGNYQLSEAGRAGNYAVDSASRQGNYTINQFEKLTIPGFELAGRQGERELESLFISTQGDLDKAGMPFRESIVFDPQAPLPGLYSNVLPPTYTQGPSVASGIAGAVIGGVKGAMAGRGVDNAGNGYWF